MFSLQHVHPSYADAVDLVPGEKGKLAYIPSMLVHVQTCRGRTSIMLVYFQLYDNLLIFAAKQILFGLACCP